MLFARTQLPDLHRDSASPEKSLSWKPYLPYFFSLAGKEDLNAVLHRSYDLFVEIGEHSHLEAAITRLIADAPDFALSLTSESTYRNDIAGIVMPALLDRFGIHDSMKMHIESCLREALVNAVVHGNLSLESRMESREDFESHYAAIEERIGKTLYKGRRVNLAAWDRNQHLELRVSDEGQGFAVGADAPENKLPHGRGLFLIRSLADSVWIAQDRRTLCMTFRR